MNFIETQTKCERQTTATATAMRRFHRDDDDSNDRGKFFFCF